MKKKLVIILPIIVVLALGSFFGIGAATGLFHKHDYSEKVVEPTCTKRGYTLFTCDCGDEYRDNYVSKLEHDYDTEWTIDTAATCANEGSKSHHCKNCSDKTDVTAIDKLEHDYDTEWTIDVVATCANEGSKSHHCKNCSDKIDVTTIDKIEHVYTEWKIDKAATCTEPGSKSRHCKNCDTANECVKIDVIEHNFQNGICKVCGKVEIETATGLEFTLSDDRTYYIVSGIGSENRSKFKIPATYNGKPVKEIGNYAFAQIDEEGDYLDIAEIAQIELIALSDNITTIGESAFQNCGYLTEITIPDSVTSIGEGAFANCSSLTSATIGNGVTSIGEYAFWGCWKLAEVINKSNLNITKGSEDNGSIAEYALNVKSEGASDIVNVNDYLFYTYDNVNYLLGYVGNDTNLVLPEKYNGQNYEIYNCAFYNCYKLASVTIPDSVTSIGDEAFGGCTSLQSITIPNSVTALGTYAFGYCSNLTSITIGNKVTSIADEVFEGCEKLVEVINKSKLNITKGSWDNGGVGYYALNVKNKGVSDIVNVNDYLFYTYDNVNYLLGYVGNDTNLVLPEKYNGQNYEIYNCAFYNCYKLASVTIPDSVTSIGDSAFEYCSSLQSITIPDSVTSIGYMAFYNCSSLQSITIPDSVTSIGYMAFYNCSSLQSITIPDSVTSIGDNAFNGCSLQYNEYNNAYYLGNYNNPYVVLIKAKDTSISSCTINANTKVIVGTDLMSGFYGESGAFFECNKLTSITIPDSVTYIGSHAFYGCRSLTSITIGNGVTSIGADAFKYCRSLTSITIGNGVTSISNKAFYSCTSLKKVYFIGTAEEWAKVEIGSDNDSFKSATVYYYTADAPSAEGNYWHYGDNGNVVEW